jgi:hypothetical protein
VISGWILGEQEGWLRGGQVVAIRGNSEEWRKEACLDKDCIRQWSNDLVHNSSSG